MNTRTRLSVLPIIRRLFVALALVCMLYGFSGCKRSETTTKSAPDSVAPKSTPDPVAELKALAANLKHPPKSIVYADIEVDVRKSDSLVSPFVGTISGKEYINDDKTDKPAYVLTFVLMANYRDGEWSYAGCTGDSLSLKDMQKMSFTYDRKTLEFAYNVVTIMTLKNTARY